MSQMDYIKCQIVLWLMQKKIIYCPYFIRTVVLVLMNVEQDQVERPICTTDSSGTSTIL